MITFAVGLQKDTLQRRHQILKQQKSASTKGTCAVCKPCVALFFKVTQIDLPKGLIGERINLIS